MKKSALIIIIFLIAHAAGYGQFIFTNYTNETPNAPGRVRCMLQGSDGLMWFATYNGLYSFDGYLFRGYKARPGDGIVMESNRLESICESGGGIWMRGYNGSVSRFDLPTEHIADVPIQNAAATNIIPDSSGCVWITTSDNNLVRAWADSATGRIVTRVFVWKSKAMVNDVKSSGDGSALILTSRGLWKYDEHEVRRIGVVADYRGMMEVGSKKVFFCGNGLMVIMEGGRCATKKLPTSAGLSSAVCLSDGRWVVASDDGVLFVISKEGRVESEAGRRNSEELKSDERRIKLVRDSHDGVWFCTGEPGVMRWDAATGRLDHLDVPGTFSAVPIMWQSNVTIAEDKNGNLWVSPSGNGLALYDSAHNVLKPFYDASLQDGWTAENTVVDVLVDKMQNLWYCGKYSGIEKVTFNRHTIMELLHGQAGDKGVDVRSVFQDSKGRIWTGSRDGVISIYDDKFHLTGYLSADGVISKVQQRSFGHAYAFAEQRDGTMWIGTKFNGLFRLKRIDDYRFSVEHFSADGKPGALCHNDVFSLYLDSHNRLWVGTFGGGLCYTLLDGGAPKFVRVGEGAANSKVRYITGDGKGTLWVGTASGLLSFSENFKSPNRIRFTAFRRNPDDASSLSCNDVFCVFFAHDGTMYACTNGGGLCRTKQGSHGRMTFLPVTTADGLRSDIVYSMQEDDDGNLWLSTESGIAKYYPRAGRIETFSQRFFSERPEFSDGLSVRLSGGQIVLPTLNTAVVYFDPARLTLSTFVPPIVLTELMVNQMEQKPSEEGILRKSVNSTEAITLPHGSNNIGIRFAALDYADPANISYAYKMEGLDSKWMNAGNRHEAVYGNLPPGKYTFMVRSTNSDGVWTDNVRKLAITVSPSFWQTGWAKALYVLLIIGVIGVSTYVLSTIMRLKQKVNIERQIADMKMQFFTEISHEFRTPLTLISGCVKEILHRGVDDRRTTEALMVVDKNSNRLLHLVNEMLDIRKLRNGKTRLSLQRIDLGRFIGSLLENFHNIAIDRQINLRLVSPDSPVVVWADAEKLDKIVFNLLSNAFRFTPRGKSITVEISQREGGARIVVADEGKGISPEHQKSIFELFSSDNTGSEMNQPHTGVGLALTRDLVALHHGSISVESEVGKGSRFTVDLPTNAPGHIADADYQASDSTVERFSHDADVGFDYASETTASTVAHDNDKPTVLVVEDNTEMRRFISAILAGKYNVVDAADGSQGMEKALEVQPDVVITDLMMPVMDGVEMARRLRADVNTSHIPIIILSARTDEESIIKGYDTGVDSYLEKPFSADVLRARVANLIESRKRLQQAYRKEYVDNVHDGSPLPGSKADKDFMNRVTEILVGNMQDDTLTVDRVAAELNMSRSVYFKKIKALTGLGPNDYLKSLRMRRAAELLRAGGKTVADIAFLVGIPDAHYFSKCFRQYYNMTPSEYRASPQTPLLNFAF